MHQDNKSKQIQRGLANLGRGVLDIIKQTFMKKKVKNYKSTNMGGGRVVTGKGEPWLALDFTILPISLVFVFIKISIWL